MDMASRRGAGFGLGEHHDAGLAYAALAMAVAVRGGRDAIARVILHTDQDSEYTAGLTRAACNRLGITLDRRRQVLGEDHPHTRESRTAPCRDVAEVGRERAVGRPGPLGLAHSCLRPLRGRWLRLSGQTP